MLYQFFMLIHLSRYHEREVGYYAAQLHLSTGHFSDLIKEVSGRRPSEWIASFTVSEACRLLLQTEKSIKEIAELLGFPEQTDFGRYFKRYTGQSPKAFRGQKIQLAPPSSAKTLEP